MRFNIVNFYKNLTPVGNPESILAKELSHSAARFGGCFFLESLEKA